MTEQLALEYGQTTSHDGVTVFDETTCADCGVAMFRHWNGYGTDWTWLDGNRRSYGDNADPAANWRGIAKIPGITNAAEYATHLLAEHAKLDPKHPATYRWPAPIVIYADRYRDPHLSGPLLPWEHWHRPVNRPAELDPGVTLPECCGMPAQFVRDGWLCRVTDGHTAAVPARSRRSLSHLGAQLRLSPRPTRHQGRARIAVWSSRPRHRHGAPLCGLPQAQGLRVARGARVVNDGALVGDEFVAVVMVDVLGFPCPVGGQESPHEGFVTSCDVVAAGGVDDSVIHAASLACVNTRVNTLGGAQ